MLSALLVVSICLLCFCARIVWGQSFQSFVEVDPSTTTASFSRSANDLSIDDHALLIGDPPFGNLFVYIFAR
jgi:hypothetical protein